MPLLTSAGFIQLSEFGIDAGPTGNVTFGCDPQDRRWGARKSSKTVANQQSFAPVRSALFGPASKLRWLQV
jgi:hypothetical protein